MNSLPESFLQWLKRKLSFVNPIVFYRRQGNLGRWVFRYVVALLSGFIVMPFALVGFYVALDVWIVVFVIYMVIEITRIIYLADRRDDDG